MRYLLLIFAALLSLSLWGQKPPPPKPPVTTTKGDTKDKKMGGGAEALRARFMKRKKNKAKDQVARGEETATETTPETEGVGAGDAVDFEGKAEEIELQILGAKTLDELRVAQRALDSLKETYDDTDIFEVIMLFELYLELSAEYEWLEDENNSQAAFTESVAIIDGFAESEATQEDAYDFNLELGEIWHDLGYYQRAADRFNRAYNIDIAWKDGSDDLENLYNLMVNTNLTGATETALEHLDYLLYELLEEEQEEGNEIFDEVYVYNSSTDTYDPVKIIDYLKQDEALIDLRQTERYQQLVEKYGL